MTRPHTPVMVREVLDALNPRDGAVFVDATFGAGGYTKALLNAAKCVVWAIDRDPEAVAGGADLVRRSEGRLTLLAGRFGEMTSLLADLARRVDGIAFDLGVSSMQLDRAERGFSFRGDGPLDMRMESSGPTAADAVNRMPEKELADIIYRYGEERHSRRIAKAIVERRADEPFTRTGQLADLVRRVVKRANDGIDPATRTFQALRIHVNDELGEIARGLAAAETMLGEGGRLAVVSFHSLEDRVVKDFLRERSGRAAAPSRHAPAAPVAKAPTFRLLKSGAIKPTDDEVAANPRARSARLRAAERTAAPPWPDGERQAA